MSYTAANVITRVRRRLADETDQSYTDDILLDAINQGSKLFAETTGCNQNMTTVVPDGSNSYISLTTANLTYRFLNVYAVQYDSVKIDFAPAFEMANWNPVSGTPTAWSYWSQGLTERIYFDSIPLVSGSVKMFYTYVPDDISSTATVIGIPDKWMEAIIHYCRYYVHDLNRDSGLAQMAWSEFDAIRQVAAKTYDGLMSRGGYAK